MRKRFLWAVGRPRLRSVLAGVVGLSIPAATMCVSASASTDGVAVLHDYYMAKSAPQPKARKSTPKYLDLMFAKYQQTGSANASPVRNLSGSVVPYCKPTPKHLDVRSDRCLRMKLDREFIAGNATSTASAANDPNTREQSTSSTQRESKFQLEGIWWTVRTRYDGLIQFVAQKHDVDPALVKAIVQAESGFDPYAVSHAGARGLMQVLPETASLFSIENLSDPQQNLRAGVLYLKHLLELFDQNVTMAVAAYNAGPNMVRLHQGVPPFNETRRYLAKVLGLRDAYASQSQRS